MSHEQRRMYHFLLLSHDDQLSAVRRLHKAGMGDYVIASAAGISVEQVRRLLAEDREAQSA